MSAADSQVLHELYTQRRAAWEHSKTELLRTIDQVSVEALHFPERALTTSLRLVALTGLGIPYDILSDITPVGDVELASHAVTLATKIVELACRVVARNIEERERAWLADITSTSVWGQRHQHSARVTLVQSMIAAASLARHGSGARRSTLGGGSAKINRAGLTVFLVAHAYGAVPRILSQPQSVTPQEWGRAVLEMMRIHHPDVASRLKEQRIGEDVQRLSRRGRSGEKDRWEVLAALVKNAGLGVVSPQALRTEMHQTKPVADRKSLPRHLREMLADDEE